METITLIDGTVINGSVMPSGSGDCLFVYLTGKTLMEGITIFGDASNVARLVVDFHGTVREYEGYTRITAINTEFGNCNLTLRRASNVA